MALFASPVRAGSHVPVQHCLPVAADPKRPSVTAGAAAVLLVVQSLLANAYRKGGFVHLSGRKWVPTWAEPF